MGILGRQERGGMHAWGRRQMLGRWVRRVEKERGVGERKAIERCIVLDGEG